MSHQDIDAAKLPNLLQLVDILKRKSSEIIAKRDANDHIDSNMEESWHSINMEYYNHADENKFIVVQTQNRRHTLKPNLRNCGFIYRGQRKEYPHILSSFARDEYDSQGNPLVLKQFRPKHLRSNLLSEDFIALLLTNPLSMMFDRGIILEPEKRPFFINMNYYGLAQHYGFKTGVVDFTTDINVAAFNQIYFGDSQVGKKMHESLLNLPKNPAYQAYFNINEYSRLTYYWHSMDVRAKRNEVNKMSIS